jgi:hypothetical protein
MSPESTIRERLAIGSSTGTAEIKAACNGCLGVPHTAFVKPHSTIFPKIHHYDAATDVFDDCEIVSNEQVGEAELALQVLQQVDNLRLHGDIEGAHRLVADDEFWFNGQGASDADPLALATAELVWVAVRVGGVKTHIVQQRKDTTPTAARFGAKR